MALRTRESSRLARLSFVLASACAAVILAVACTDITAAPLPTGAIEWTPPARFALWWQMTESCSGKRGDLRSIRWYVVPDATDIDVGGKRVQGATLGTDRIVLAGAYRLSGTLVRHEMLHALLRVSGHPRDAFLVACDGVVVCVESCETDAGGRATPPLDAPEILPRDVATRVEVVPRQPAASQDDGAVAAIVSITNPRPTAVWVRLTPQASNAPVSETFGIAVDFEDSAAGSAGSYDWTEAKRFPLAPNETRRWVWDDVLPAGSFGIRGWFNSDTTPRFTLTVER